jgi:beta-galactosidase
LIFFMKTIITISFLILYSTVFGQSSGDIRERILINDGWRFFLYDSLSEVDELIYDARPDPKDHQDGKAADAQPTEAVNIEAKRNVLKPWILPSGNRFLRDSSKHHIRPAGNPGEDFAFVRMDFDDHAWENVHLPHDWAIKGPFMKGADAKVGGGMGRLPSPGVAWYRKKITIPAVDKGRRIFLEIDGAMSYAMVWVNGKLAGGWPYGYASFHIDLTPYVVYGSDNQIAIRLDNPPASSRWYPGGGLYRNVWLTKTSPIHMEQWGTYVRTVHASNSSATVEVDVGIENASDDAVNVQCTSSVFVLDDKTNTPGRRPVATVVLPDVTVTAKGSRVTSAVLTIPKPRLWGPPPGQEPNLYRIVTTLAVDGKVVDQQEQDFGIRTLAFHPEKGLFVNGEHVFIKGVNQHHDLGALGAAFNVRAAERQLQLLRDMGCNAIRMAHNPPAPELLELTDRMGFLVVDEIFDGWERKKTPLDFHLIFPEWHEQDIRAFVRRDRNHPSVIMWSYGNEVGEQYTDKAGAALARRLQKIVKEEDDTRPATISMNYAKPNMPLPEVPDIISLNYQGEGIRDAPEYAGLEGIRTSPLFPAFHNKFPGKLIVSSENAAAVSTRGEYLFPVIKGISAPVRDTTGGDSRKGYVSAYELYTVDFGSSADKVFASEDKHSYVAGGFVWSGWDYLGEPTPYYQARSSYFGVIDLAGFPKDRFYLYQSRWRPDYPMAHILPHWNWPDRLGKVTPVHVFTSGDEAELFLNGKSLGRRKKQQYEYRLRWDDVVYEPGELKVIVYNKGKKWSEERMTTTGKPFSIAVDPDRKTILSDGKDLVFVTVKITDSKGRAVPVAKNYLRFRVSGPGKIVATDNGDPTSLVSFASRNREAFNGLCLVIIQAEKGSTGDIVVTAESDALTSGVSRVRVVQP